MSGISINKKLARSLAAAATTPDSTVTAKPSDTITTSPPTSPTLTTTPTVLIKSPAKLLKGLPGYLLDHVDDGSGFPVWSKSGTLSSLEALRETDVKSASLHELINIVAFKRLFKIFFQEFSKDYLKTTDLLLRAQLNDQGKKLVSKTHPKAVDIGATELGILIPNPVLEIVDTVDTLYQQMFDSELFTDFDFNNLVGCLSRVAISPVISGVVTTIKKRNH